MNSHFARWKLVSYTVSGSLKLASDKYLQGTVLLPLTVALTLFREFMDQLHTLTA